LVTLIINIYKASFDDSGLAFLFKVNLLRQVTRIFSKRGVKAYPHHKIKKCGTTFEYLTVIVSDF
jgi:hypothetical protein